MQNAGRFFRPAFSFDGYAAAMNEMSLSKIEEDAPASWRELQERVARILRESGVTASVEKRIQTARGEVSVDVWAHDSAATPTQTYLVECKRWQARVPQAVVHGFRTVVGDSGANWGAIISCAGFQKGALAAAEYSNVRLLTWDEFQDLFAERWFSQYFVRQVANTTGALIEYTEPANSRVFRKADSLSTDQRQVFQGLRKAHFALGAFCSLITAEALGAFRLIMGEDAAISIPRLPLRSSLSWRLDTIVPALPAPILDADSYRGLLQSVTTEAAKAVAQFDAAFGERA